MALRDLVYKNRSYRSFSPDRAVTKAELREFVELCGLCPSAANKQPLRFRLCAGSAEMAAVLPHIRFAAALPDRHFPPEGHEPPAAVVICMDRRVTESASACLWDAGIMAQTMLLAAAEKRLGGCMVGNFSREGLTEALALPEHLTPLLVVVFGEPDETVVLEPCRAGDKTAYYRDENDVHHVPKVVPEDLVI